MTSDSIRPEWWGAAFLTALATALLGGGGSGQKHTKAAFASLVFAFPASVAFATTDVLCQKWAPAWGFGHFAPTMFLVVALLSCGLVPFFHAPLSQLAPATWRVLIPGAVLLAIQASGVAYSIITYGSATVVNIIYNTRAVWSVVLVWTVGHWFGNTERSHGHHVMGRRLFGAMLLLAAIAIVMRK